MLHEIFISKFFPNIQEGNTPLARKSPSVDKQKMWCKEKRRIAKGKKGNTKKENNT